MANKTINQLSAGGALSLTDEIERQVTGGGASQKFTGAQLVALVEAYAASFAQAAVSFNSAINARTANLSVAVNVGSGNVVLNADGSATFAAGKITLNADGSVSLANGELVINTDGQVNVGALSLSLIKPDGSATFGGVVVEANGNMQVGGFFTSPADIEVTDTASGFVLKSPNGTRYRIKVDDAGNLGTEAA